MALSASAGPPPRPTTNRLLAALPPEDFDRLKPHLKVSTLPLGWTVYEPGAPQRYVYFPTDAIISLLNLMHDGSSAEIAVIGNDGIAGISLFMGGDTTPSHAVVQSAGGAYRLNASLLKAEFHRGGVLQHVLP